MQGAAVLEMRDEDGNVIDYDRKFQGKDTVTSTCGDRYEGQLKDGKMHGKGTLLMADVPSGWQQNGYALDEYDGWSHQTSQTQSHVATCHGKSSAGSWRDHISAIDSRVWPVWADGTRTSSTVCG